MHNILIDNSYDSLSMATYIKRCLSIKGRDTVQIATGDWDVLGMSILIDEFSKFLEQDGTRFQLLIGKDPYVYTSLVQNPKYKDATYLKDFIRTDINHLELKPEYESVIQFLLKNLSTGKMQVRIYPKK